MTDISKFPNIYGQGKGAALQILPMAVGQALRQYPMAHSGFHRATPLVISTNARADRLAPAQRVELVRRINRPRPTAALPEESDTYIPEEHETWHGRPMLL